MTRFLVVFTRLLAEERVQIQKVCPLLGVTQELVELLDAFKVFRICFRTRSSRIRSLMKDASLWENQPGDKLR